MLEPDSAADLDVLAQGTNPADAGTAVSGTSADLTAVTGFRFEPAAWADCD